VRFNLIKLIKPKLCQRLKKLLRVKQGILTKREVSLYRQPGRVIKVDDSKLADTIFGPTEIERGS